MKLCSKVVIACLFSFAAVFHTRAVMGGEWLHSFEAAKQKATQSGMPLLVHFHASWCGPCKNMERNVLSKPDVKAALGKTVIAVKVDSDQRKDLVRRFSVSALPSDIIISPGGSVVHRSVGSPGRSAYLAALNRFGHSTVTEDTSAIAARDSAKPPVPRPRNNTVVSSESESLKSSDVEVAANNVTENHDTVQTVALTRTLKRESGRRIGLNGFSPVSLSSVAEWNRGQEKLSFEYEGVCYLLSSEDELAEFKQNPRRYIPFLHGCDPVSLYSEQKFEAGAIEFGATYEDRVYFFASRKNRETFLKSPRKYAIDRSLVFFQTSNHDS